MMLGNFITYLCAYYYWLWGVCFCHYYFFVPSHAWMNLQFPPGIHWPLSIYNKNHHNNVVVVTTTGWSSRRRASLPSSLNDDQKDTPSENKKNSDNNNNDNSNNNNATNKKNWLEAWAMEGANKIAQLDIQERTQRTMLAEMAEDNIYELNLALEELINEDTGEISDLAQAKEIAMQTRSLQLQYRALVRGEPASMLQAMASLNEHRE